MNSKQEFYSVLKDRFPEEQNLENKIPFFVYSNYPDKATKQFVVYEDWWIKNPEIVISKVSAILGQNERIFARKTKVKRIIKKESDAFLKANHIYGTTKGKYQLGLFLENELVAVATFSSQKNLDVGRST